MREIVINHYPWNYAQLWVTPLRYNVFVREQKLPLKGEFDSLDPRCIHFVAFNSNQPVATARLTTDHHVGRVAVQRPWRKQGIGLKVMQAIIEFTGKHELYLKAQLPVVAFYERLGFVCNGNVFIDSGIEHINMVLPGHRKAA